MKSSEMRLQAENFVFAIFRLLTTDTPVTMAVKSHIRNSRPVLIALATNDALAGSLHNISKLLKGKYFYFVPFAQDDPNDKPTSAISDFSLIPDAVQSALEGRQLQPILI